MAKLRDYHRKKYSNPFFKKTKSGFFFRSRRLNYGGRGRGSWRVKFATFLFIVLAGVLIYFVLFSSYFVIKNVKISGLERISQEDLRGIIDSQVFSRRFLIFSQNNIFIFNEVAAEKKINEKYALNVLKINKRLPGTLKISLEEKKTAMIWKTADKFYMVDWDGVIIREILAEEVSEYPENQSGTKMAVVFDESNASVAVKDEILTRQIAQGVVDLRNNFPRVTGLQISNLAMNDRNDPTIKCMTHEGWEAHFSLISDLNAQINKLAVFLEEKNQGERKGLQYIDMRFEDRIYYK